MQSWDTEGPWVNREPLSRSEGITTPFGRAVDITNAGRRVGFRGKTRSCVSHARAVASSFHRWFFGRFPNDRRLIETLPPVELDPFLAEYFETVQKPRGGNYTFDSFRLLRPNLDNYLQSQNYPWRIVTSNLFPLSKLAFDERKRKLKAESLSGVEGRLEQT